MRIATLASTSVVAMVLAALIGPVSATAQSATPDGLTTVPVPTVNSVLTEVPTPDSEAVSATLQFATLNGMAAVPMASGEMDAIKGLHVHFLDANGGFHLAGNGNNQGIGEGNWYLNGSPDGQPVAPSYHGLCVAGPIIIPTGPNPSQCP